MTLDEAIAIVEAKLLGGGLSWRLGTDLALALNRLLEEIRVGATP